jgi:hypothetical protein
MNDNAARQNTPASIKEEKENKAARTDNQVILPNDIRLIFEFRLHIYLAFAGIRQLSAKTLKKPAALILATGTTTAPNLVSLTEGGRWNIVKFFRLS